MERHRQTYLHYAWHVGFRDPGGAGRDLICAHGKAHGRTQLAEVAQGRLRGQRPGRYPLHHDAQRFSARTFDVYRLSYGASGCAAVAFTENKKISGHAFGT